MFVIQVLGDDGDRWYYTALRDSEGGRWFDTDPHGKHVLTYPEKSSGGSDLVHLLKEGYRAQTIREIPDD